MALRQSWGTLKGGRPQTIYADETMISFTNDICEKHGITVSEAYRRICHAGMGTAALQDCLALVDELNELKAKLRDITESANRASLKAEKVKNNHLGTYRYADYAHLDDTTQRRIASAYGVTL